MDTVFALNATVTLTFDLVTSKFIGTIYWSPPIIQQSRMTVTHKYLKVLRGHGFCIKCFCDLDLWPSDHKMYSVISWPWPIFLKSTEVSLRTYKSLYNNIVYGQEFKHLLLCPWCVCEHPSCDEACRAARSWMDGNSHPQQEQITIHLFLHILFHIIFLHILFHITF